MTPLKTPLLQAAYDHAKTAKEMLDQRLEDASVGLDADSLAARSHLFEAMMSLNASLVREDGQKEMRL